MAELGHGANAMAIIRSVIAVAVQNLTGVLSYFGSVLQRVWRIFSAHAVLP